MILMPQACISTYIKDLFLKFTGSAGSRGRLPVTATAPHAAAEAQVTGHGGAAVRSDLPAIAPPA
jgi:hypothetical protein